MTDGLAATLDALRHGALRRALLAFLVFSVAEWATWITLLVWAYDERGVGAAATVSVVQLVPAVVVAPLGSVIGDRGERGRALAIGYLAQALTMLLTGLLLVADAPFALTCAGGVLVTCAVTLTRPVHNATLPTVSHTPAELLAGNSASITAEGVGGFLGPLACGLLISGVGPGSVYLLFGVLLLGSAALVLRLPVVRLADGDEPGVMHAAESFTRRTLAGVRELREQPASALLLLMVTGQYVVVGAMDILLMVVAIDVLETGTSGPGFLASALGVGSVLGALATVLLVGRRRLSPALGAGLLVTGAPLALLPLGVVPASAVLLLAVSGAGKSFFDVAGHTLLQRAVPDRVLARVFGVEESVMTAALAVGAALAPVAVATLGRSGALVATGALLPVSGLLAWPWLRRLDRAGLQPGRHLGLLRTVPTLRAAPLPVLELLSREAAELLVPAGDAVVREGQRGDRFYVVAAGEVAVSRNGAPIRTLGPGSSFGEIALLHDTPRTATVTAVAPTSLVTVSRDDFLRAVGSTTATREAARAVAESYLAEDGRRSGAVSET